jgi:hypothetical protein
MVPPPPADAAQRWDLRMKPFVKVQSPGAPSWSTVRKLLSPTLRPISGKKYEGQENEIFTKRLSDHIALISPAVSSAHETLMGIEPIDKDMPILYMWQDVHKPENLICSQACSLNMVSWTFTVRIIQILPNILTQYKLVTAIHDIIGFLSSFTDLIQVGFSKVQIEFPKKWIRGHPIFVIPVFKHKDSEEWKTGKEPVKNRHLYILTRRAGTTGWERSNFLEIWEMLHIAKRDRRDMHL